MGDHVLPTDDETAELKEVFDLFDQNKDGKITRAELYDVLRTMGLGKTEEEIKAIIHDYDSNDNGTMEFSEFLEMVSQKEGNSTVDSENETRKTFLAFDLNRDGYISKSELRKAMENLGENPTDEEIDKMMQEADVNHDNLISYEEFVKIVNS